MTEKRAILETYEFDEMARLGFAALRRVLTEDKPSEEDREKGKLALSLAAKGTSRMSAETNRVSVAYKIAKETGIRIGGLSSIIGNLLGQASGDVESKNGESLAPTESTISAGAPTDSKQTSKRKNGALAKARAKR